MISLGLPTPFWTRKLPPVSTLGGGFDHRQGCSVTGGSPDLSTFHRREVVSIPYLLTPRPAGVHGASVGGTAGDTSSCWSPGHCVHLESLNPSQTHVLGCQRGQDSLSFIGAK